MIRSIITPEQQNISLQLPENFVGKKVEVIAFVLDDAKEEPMYINRTLINRIANNADFDSFKESSVYFASEKTLAKDWLTPEEDKAWQDL